MSNQYTHQILKVVVAQICQTIGWHSIQSTPLELMVDILNRYLEDITKQTYRYSELYNRTEANLDDVGLAYKDMNINLSDIAEYIQYVDPVPCAVEVPKYPLKKESHMNFLKPGSKEVVTRPVHIHEYLPAINPPSDDDDSNLDKTDKIDGALDVVNISGEETPFFKRPCSISNPDKLDIKKQKVTFEEESRPIREISSVMMTTSGFISPARDGKLPDSKPPVIHVPEERKPIVPLPVPSVTPALPVSSLDGNKFNDKKIKKNKSLPEKEKEKKKEKIPKEILKAKKLEKLEKLGKLSSTIKSEIPNSNGGFGSMHSFVDRIKNEPMKTMMSSSLPPPTLALHAGANILSEKPNNLINPIAPVPKKLGRPRKDKSAELLGNPNKKPPKINNFLKPNPDILAPFFKPMSDFSALPKARIDPPFMMGNLPLMSSSGLNTAFPIVGSSSSFPIPPPSIPLDEKIPSEPDKQKLNIFKKISKVKEEFSKNENLIIKTEPKQSNVDQVIVIDDDQNSNPLPPTPSTPNIPGFKKDSDINEILMKSEHPINMILPKSLIGSSLPHHTDDFKFGIEPNRTSTPNKIPMIDGNPPQKIRKKYKTKDKANKKFDFFSEELLKADMYSQLKSSKKMMEEMANQHAASRNASIAAIAQQNSMMFPFPFASGPGLIPQPGLFPAFNLNRPPPFGLLPGQNFSGGLNPPLPDINNMFKMYRKPNDIDTQSSKPIHIDKTHCNVAPLVPESLKLEIPMHSSQMASSSTSSTSNKSKPLGSSSKMFDDMFTSIQLSSKKIKLEPPSEPINSISLSSPMGSPTIPSSSHLNPFSSNDNKMTDFSKEIIEIDDNCSMSSKDKMKEDKKHKKDKKEKEGKIKKKKDKKEKLKNKEKSDKKKEKEDKKEFKEKLKKEKKEKRKEKERALQPAFHQDMESISSNDNFDLTSSVPRLTLKLERNISPPVTPDNKKSSMKSIKKEDFESDDYGISGGIGGGSGIGLGFGLGTTTVKREREPSPELVRISPLVTRPPKPIKPMTMKKKDDGDNKANNSHDNINASQNIGLNATPTPGRGRPKGSTKLVNAAKNLANANKMNKSSNPGNGLKSPKQHHQHQQITLGTLASTISAMQPMSTVPLLSPPVQPLPTTTSTTLSAAPTNLPISGGSNSTSNNNNNNSSSNNNTLNNNNNSNNNNNNIGNSNSNNNNGTQISTSSLSSTSTTLPTGIRDSDGNQVWICPACGRVDDGTPMIGCDGCDAWYHWVCVGIQVPPDANEDWYCRVCIVKKQESQGGEKKKKRKKKDKKDH